MCSWTKTRDTLILGWCWWWCAFYSHPSQSLPLLLPPVLHSRSNLGLVIIVDMAQPAQLLLLTLLLLQSVRSWSWNDDFVWYCDCRRYSRFILGGVLNRMGGGGGDSPLSSIFGTNFHSELSSKPRSVELPQSSEPKHKKHIGIGTKITISTYNQSDRVKIDTPDLDCLQGRWGVWVTFGPQLSN